MEEELPPPLAVNDAIAGGPGEPSAGSRIVDRVRAIGLSKALVCVGIATVGAAWLWAGGSSSVFGSEQDTIDWVAAIALLLGGAGALFVAIRGVLRRDPDDDG